MTKAIDDNKNKVGRPFLPDEERKDYKITIRVDKDYKNKLTELSKNKNMTIAEFIRNAIDDYIENNY